MSYINYKEWDEAFHNTVITLDKYTSGDNCKACYKKFVASIIKLEDSDIDYDLDVLSLKLLSCRLCTINNKAAYQITSYINGLQHLTLYLEPITTSCSRHQALLYKIFN